jgi:SAM-dependent methyltransferase
MLFMLFMLRLLFALTNERNVSVIELAVDESAYLAFRERRRSNSPKSKFRKYARINDWICNVLVLQLAMSSPHILIKRFIEKIHYFGDYSQDLGSAKVGGPLQVSDQIVDGSGNRHDRIIVDRYLGHGYYFARNRAESNPTCLNLLKPSRKHLGIGPRAGMVRARASRARTARCGRNRWTVETSMTTTADPHGSHRSVGSNTGGGYAPPDKAAELAAIYRERFGHNLSYRRSVWKILVEQLFRPRAGRPNSVLEIGTGYGDFINQFDSPQRAAMDLNPDAADYLEAGVTFHCQDATKRWPLDDESVDLIFTSNFFEHLPDKDAICRVLDEAHRVLVPGGRVMAIGPNIKHVPGAYWDFWDHTTPLTDKSLAEAFKLGGFTIAEKRSRTLPYTMSNVREAPVVLLKLYLRMPFAWRIFGHQFLVVGEKPRR